MYFHGYPEAKFSQKEFLSKLQTEKDLQIAFATVAREALTELLSDTSREKAEAQIFDLNAAILNIA
jgi:hypothetical protein